MQEMLKQRCAAATNLESLRTVVDSLAECISAPSSRLPTYGKSIDGAHPHIEHDALGFHYVIVERGCELRRQTTKDPLELLYWVYHDVTFDMACSREVKNRVMQQDNRRLLFKFQLDLLGRLDASWRERGELEIRRILQAHPFDDLANVRATLCGQLKKKGMSDQLAWETACRQYPLPSKQLAAPDLTATGRQWKRIASYFPLVAIGLEVLWVVVLFLTFIFMVGDAPYTNTGAKEPLLDFIAALPATLGLLLGLVAMVRRWPSRKLEWVCLTVGSLGCAALVFPFACEMLL